MSRVYNPTASHQPATHYTVCSEGAKSNGERVRLNYWGLNIGGIEYANVSISPKRPRNLAVGEKRSFNVYKSSLVNKEVKS